MAELIGVAKYDVVVHYCDGGKDEYHGAGLGTPSNFLLGLNTKRGKTVYMPLVNIKRFTIQEVKGNAKS